MLEKKDVGLSAFFMRQTRAVRYQIGSLEPGGGSALLFRMVTPPESKSALLSRVGAVYATCETPSLPGQLCLSGVRGRGASGLVVCRTSRR